MKTKITEEIPFRELTGMLKGVTLKNRQWMKPYADDDVSIELKTIIPTFVRPVSSYVIETNLKFQELLRKTLNAEYGIDTFKMDRVYKLRFMLQDSAERMLIPPIVEISHYDGGLPLIMDGIHRIYLAWQNREDINSIVISNVIIPYYGYPLPKGWFEVACLAEMPEKKEKRNYRLDSPLLHYALYRDLEPLGIGRPRGPDELGEISRLVKFMEAD